MKICSKCNYDKPITEYAWKNKQAGTRQTQCDPCRKATAKASYEKHKQKIIAKTVARKAKYMAANYGWKSLLSCVNCGETYDRCLEFHHVDPSEKEGSVADLLRSGAPRNAFKEAQKCVVLCANCHRKIHGGAFELTFEQQAASGRMIKAAFQTISP